MTANTEVHYMADNNSSDSMSSLNNKLDLNLNEFCRNEFRNPLVNSISSDCRQLLAGHPNYTLFIESLQSAFNATSMASDPSDETFQFEQSWQMQAMWSLIFGTMILIAIVGNLIVITIISSHRSMRTVTNYFLLNLCITDLLSAASNASFNYIFMLSGHWPFGHIYCVINNFMANLLIAVSVFTITAISIDRYIAIVYPLKPRMTKRKAITNIIIVWTSGIIFAMPSLVFAQTLTITHGPEKTRTICLLEWPDGLSGQSRLDFVYNIAFLLLTYIVPLTTMAIAYSLMARVLWGSQGIGEGNANSVQQQTIIRSKQKVVQMLICVVSVFGICWLPYHAYFLLTYQWPEVIMSQFIQQIYLGIYWLAMANSMFDPIILLVMNKRQIESDFGTTATFNKRVINNRSNCGPEVADL